jgi:RNA 3'-terminal phosphate cyclase
VRLAVGLAALIGQTIRITNIRGNRQGKQGRAKPCLLGFARARALSCSADGRLGAQA